ncbi:DUF4331 domain-containing protein [Pseudokineococcus basanitobsidens]|uniref:DUF4331 domain-containing protein n=1 Tax=Pseudokineococcus basanitobsidens TaxID=1926649 RepID=A0ABU8RGF7_9ACTN
MSPTHRTTRAQRAAAAVAATAVAVGGTSLVLGAQGGWASSHREAPLTAADPTIDNTDTYAFVSPDAPGTTTLIASWLPFQEPAGGPNFYPWATGDQAHYNVKIDNDGDAVPDITYQWTFDNVDARGDVDYPDGADLPADGTFLYNNGPVSSLDDPTLLFKQTYTLTEITDEGEDVLVEGAPVAPSHVGDASFPDYQALRDEAVVDVADGGKSFVGQAEDSFFLDLRVFDLLYGGDLSETGNDTLAPYNVNSVALQLPTESLLGDATYEVTGPDGSTSEGPDPTIGVWSTTDRASVRTAAADGTLTGSGEFVQVSRLGNPLVNEVVIPANLKDAFNALPPEQDADVTAAVNKVLNPELPYLLNGIYGLPVKETPRTDLQAIFLTGLKGLNQPLADEVRPSEQLRLNTSVPVTEEPNRLGVLAGDNQGFPNGRRPTDDVLDIALQAVAGAVSVDETGAPTGVEIVDALAAGDGVDANNVDFSDSFPYLALPNSGSGTVADVPSGGVDTGSEAVATGGTSPLVPVGAGVVGLGALGYLLVSSRRRREGSA